MKQQLCIIVAIVSSGIMAGIFFTWANAVMPGIGRLDDVGYLTAFKSMNKTIINPMFMLVLFMPVFAIPAAAVCSYATVSRLQFSFIVMAGILYCIGCISITMAGNVPLNERLDKTLLETISVQDLRQLRLDIEIKWNMFNRIRMYASVASFVLLVVSAVFLRSK